MKRQWIFKNLTKALSICLCCILCIGVLSCTSLTVFGADEPSDVVGSARITDLTGYTVLVSPGWESPPNLGDFILYGNYILLYEIPIHDQFINFRIGISARGLGQADVIGFEGLDVPPNYGFQLDIYGGKDVTSSTLIDWFYDNNATFINNNESSLSTFTIYNPATEQITAEYQYEDGMTFGEWVNSEYNIDGYSIVVGSRPATLGQTDNIKSYVASNVSETTDDYNDCSLLMTTYGDYQFADTLIRSQNYALGVMRVYKPCFSHGYDLGFGDGEGVGYQTGYDEGYLLGKTEGQSSAIGSNLIGSGFTAITDALNQIIVYQSSTGTVVTLWIIISGAVGIALFIWILKLFAGG